MGTQRNVLEAAAERWPQGLKPQQRAFLAAFAECGTVRDAARQVGVGRRTVYDWLAGDAAFASALDDAREDVADKFERILMEKAADPRSAWDVTALIFLLKKLRPAYRDNVTVRSESVSLSLTASIERLPAEHRRRLLELALGQHTAPELPADEVPAAPVR